MSQLYDIFKTHPQISTDTRKVEAGSIFFALKGANFDGNTFAQQALELGAAYVVVDDESVASDDPRVILVDDVLTSLQALAREHRAQLAIPILAITGSNGKTTTKELTRCVLALNYKIYATQGNLNNHIGVPLTLLSMDGSIDLGIVEMGASAQEEIALLCSIAEPNYGIITNIGRAHLEGFNGEQGIKKGKGELFDYLAQHAGGAFVLEEDQTLTAMADQRESLEQIRYSKAIAEGVKHNLVGEYNSFNIAAAIAIGRHFNIDNNEINSAIENYNPDNNRSQRVVTQHNTLIMDCYNANPSSMWASINNFIGEAADGREAKIMILGDMLELGDWSQEEHRKIIDLAMKQQDMVTLFVGSEFGKEGCKELSDHSAKQIEGPSTRHFTSSQELKEHLMHYPINDRLILIKGSRSIGLESVIEALS